MNVLIRVERYITYFNIGEREELGEINVDVIPIETLLKIIKAKYDDPLLYDQYPLDKHQLTEINSLLPEKINFDSSKYDYYIECAGIYE